MQEHKIYSLLAICKKAGKALSGEFKCEQSVKSGRSSLVIISQEASGNTTKKFSNMCAWYKVPCITFGSKERLGESIGCSERAVISIEDEGLAAKLHSLIGGADDGMLRQTSSDHRTKQPYRQTQQISD